MKRLKGVWPMVALPPPALRISASGSFRMASEETATMPFSE